MGKVPRKKSAVTKAAHNTAIRENISALKRHTKELHRNAAVLATHSAVLSRITAKQIVYSVVNEPLTLPDATPLSKCGLDFNSLAGTAAKIRNEYRVQVDDGPVQACKTIADLIKVVTAAM